MLLRTDKKSSGRVEPKKETPVRILTATTAMANLTITFDQAVVLKGVPGYTTDLAGVTPVSAVMNNPTTLRITFSADLAAATMLTIPFEDPAIRSTVGGFVANSTFPI